jgi:hypothetical protein
MEAKELIRFGCARTYYGRRMPKSKFIKVFKPYKVQTVFEDGFDNECYIKCFVQTVYKIERISSLSSSTEMEVQVSSAFPEFLF